jgi:hypothetical protein
MQSETDLDFTETLHQFRSVEELWEKSVWSGLGGVVSGSCMQARLLDGTSLSYSGTETEVSGHYSASSRRPGPWIQRLKSRVDPSAASRSLSCQPASLKTTAPSGVYSVFNFNTVWFRCGHLLSLPIIPILQWNRELNFGRRCSEKSERRMDGYSRIRVGRRIIQPIRSFSLSRLGRQWLPFSLLGPPFFAFARRSLNSKQHQRSHVSQSG